MPRTTAASRTTGLIKAEATTGRRTAATPARESRTVGSGRPSLKDAVGRGKSAAPAERGPSGKGGWAGYRGQREERSSKYPRLEVPERGKAPGLLVKFAEDEPFDYIWRHWVLKRPLTCIRDNEAGIESCELCVIGAEDSDIKAKPVLFYNMIAVGSDGVRLVVWELSSEPAREVEKQYDKAVDAGKGLSDPSYYYVLSKDKKDNGFFDFDVERILASNLADEGQGEPLGDDEIAHALRRGLFTPEVIYRNTKDQIAEAAAKYRKANLDD